MHTTGSLPPAFRNWTPSLPPAPGHPLHVARLWGPGIQPSRAGEGGDPQQHCGMRMRPTATQAISTHPGVNDTAPAMEMGARAVWPHRRALSMKAATLPGAIDQTASL